MSDFSTQFQSYQQQINHTLTEIFNFSDNSSPITIDVNIDDLGLDGIFTIINLWNGEEIDLSANVFSQKLSAHESGLFKIVKQ